MTATIEKNNIVIDEIVKVNSSWDNKVNRKEYCKNIALERIGETRKNNCGSVMYIIKYTSNTDITVQFKESGYITTHRTYAQFQSGGIKCPYDITVYGVGWIGEGKYKATINGKITPQYRTWTHMLERCYSANYHSRKPTYQNCTVCDEWLDFQVFGKWFDENYCEIDGKGFLDKDILFRDSKIYNPINCLFIPGRINTLMIKCDSARGEFPIGVSYNKITNSFTAQCSNGNNKTMRLGSFNTPEVAFNTYKKYKENLIKEVADDYKDRIPQKLYNALYRYEVRITD